MHFSKYGIYNQRLEFKAIQKYSHYHTFEYIPVLDRELSDEFKTKLKIVTENKECQRLLDNYNLLEMDGGFRFLNSEKSIVLLEEVRELEDCIINNEILLQNINASIDAYENSMISNIYTFSKERSYNKAIFMCGAAHRKSIIEKIRVYDKNSEVELKWSF